MNADERRHLADLIANHKRRLHLLEKQAANFGISCPPEVLMEIEDIRKKIDYLEHQIHTNAQRSYVQVKNDVHQLKHDLENIDHQLKKVVIMEERIYRFLGIPVFSVSVIVSRMAQVFVVALAVSALLIGSAIIVATRPQVIIQPTMTVISVNSTITPISNTIPSPTFEPTKLPSTPSTAPATSTPTSPQDSETPVLSNRLFTAQVEQTFPGTGITGERQSCIQGTVIDRNGKGISGALININIGDQQSTREVVTNEAGEYNVCNIPVGHHDFGWSVVLLRVPNLADVTRGDATNVWGNVYVNGAADQTGVVNFVEK